MSEPIPQVIRLLYCSSVYPLKAQETDVELLSAYVRNRDDSAFATLLRRHGPMVYGVCRRLLGNSADAEDAFQATFIVLVRKAGTIQRRTLLANWLYGVAFRTAMKARTARTRRQIRERTVARPEAVQGDIPDEMRTLLDKALDRLPEKYRKPIVLCELQGKTRQEAARQLGWPEGTVATRLRRGRELLANRLKQQGVSCGMMATLFTTEPAKSGVPVSLVSLTLQILREDPFTKWSRGVASLSEGVLKAMTISKLKGIGVGIFLPILLLVAFGLVLKQGLLAQNKERAKGSVAETSGAPAAVSFPNNGLAPTDQKPNSKMLHLMLFQGVPGKHRDPKYHRHLMTIPVTLDKPFSKSVPGAKVNGVIRKNKNGLIAKVKGQLTTTSGQFDGRISEDAPFMPRALGFGSIIMPFYFVVTKNPGKHLDQKPEQKLQEEFDNALSKLPKAFPNIMEVCNVAKAFTDSHKDAKAVAFLKKTALGKSDRSPRQLAAFLGLALLAETHDTTTILKSSIDQTNPLQSRAALLGITFLPTKQAKTVAEDVITDTSLRYQTRIHFLYLLGAVGDQDTIGLLKKLDRTDISPYELAARVRTMKLLKLRLAVEPQENQQRWARQEMLFLQMSHWGPGFRSQKASLNWGATQFIRIEPEVSIELLKAKLALAKLKSGEPDWNARYDVPLTAALIGLKKNKTFLPVLDSWATDKSFIGSTCREVAKTLRATSP